MGMQGTDPALAAGAAVYCGSKSGARVRAGGALRMKLATQTAMQIKIQRPFRTDRHADDTDLTLPRTTSKPSKKATKSFSVALYLWEHDNHISALLLLLPLTAALAS